MPEPASTEPPLPSDFPDDALALNREAEVVRRRRNRIERATVIIPRLRAVGYLGLAALIAAHNALVFGDLKLQWLGLFGITALAYSAVSKLLLVAYYNPDSKLDLGDVFLAGDVPVFVMAVYCSGGEHSWLLPVLCMRVGDQVGTARRRALGFGVLTAVAQSGLVLIMLVLEQRPIAPGVELAKVLLVFMCNWYLALATTPGERQRERATRIAQTMRDLIEELQRKGAELQVQRERAESASRAKTVFLANMSHEIRTPLTAVLGMTDLLLRQKLGPGQREIVETVQLAGKSLHALVNDVLDMSKVESGKLELHLGEVELGQLVQSAVEPLRVLADVKGLQLEVLVSDLGERPIQADALRLRQVLSNLVGNAIKFTQQGTVEVRVKGAASAVTGGAPATSSAGMRVRFEVQDSGIGIAKEAAQRVFDAFEQADESTTRTYGGTGLGLTISRRLVEMMGGEITLHSELGKGSCFAFELAFPFASERPAQTSHASRAGNRARLRALSPHVLVVEDIEVNRILMKDVLMTLGCRVTLVEDGQRALAELEPEHDYDVVVMDWHMPVLDGLQTTLRVRRHEQAQKRKRIPIIGFTASAFDDDVARCKQAGMDCVLRKPLVRPQLEEALWHCLGVNSEKFTPEANAAEAV